MNIYTVQWEQTNTGKKIVMEVYASNTDNAFEGLGLDSMEWKKAKILNIKDAMLPVEGQVKGPVFEDDNYMSDFDEEEQ